MKLSPNKNRLAALTRLPQAFKLLCEDILNHYRVNMNLIVNVHKGVRKLGFEWATRQAWKCGMKANLVTRVVGVAKGQVVCVIEGVRAELSTEINNLHHNDEKQGRYVFIGGELWEPNNLLAPAFPSFMFMHVRNLGNKHKYMTDDELLFNLA